MANAMTPVGGTGRYDPQIQKLLADIENYGKFDYAGEGSYKQILDNLLGYGDFGYSKQADYDKILQQVVNPEAFAYDPTTDPTWSSYKKIYRREGDRAAENAMTRASVATGGVPSSYAVAAAQQAQNQYNAQMADMLPALRQNAYQEYLNNYDRAVTGLSALTADRSDEHARWQEGYSKLQSDLAALEADRSHQYGKWQDGYNMLNTSLGNYSAINESAMAQQQEAYNRLLTLITTTGYAPSAADLASAGMSTEEAAAWVNYYNAQNAPKIRVGSPTPQPDSKPDDKPEGWTPETLAAAAKYEVDRILPNILTEADMGPIGMNRGYYKNYVENQIEKYINQIADPELREEVGVQLCIKYGIV